MKTSELFTEEHWNYLKKLILSLSNNSIDLNNDELFEMYDSLPNPLKFHSLIFGFEDIEWKSDFKKWFNSL